MKCNSPGVGGTHIAHLLSGIYVQEDEEYFACKWSVDAGTGAPLLLLAGKNALLHVIDCATGTLEAVSGCVQAHLPGVHHMLTCA